MNLYLFSIFKFRCHYIDKLQFLVIGTWPCMLGFHTSLVHYFFIYLVHVLQFLGNQHFSVSFWVSWGIPWKRRVRISLLFYRHSNQIFDLLVEIYMELSKLLSFMNNSTMGSPSVRLLAYFCHFLFTSVPIAMVEWML